VLHIIDGLGGGGSERHVWEIVRMSDPQQVSHRVVTVFPDDGTFVYAERLRRAGAYLQEAARESDETANGAEAGLSNLIKSRVPQSLKRPLRPVRSAAISVRNHFAQALSPTPAQEDASASRDTDARLMNRSSAHELVMEGVYSKAMERLMGEYARFRPDVIQGHTFHGFSLGLSLKLMYSRPMVYFVPALFSQLRDAKVGWLIEQYRSFHQGVDRFVTGYTDELVGIGVPAEKIIRLSVAVDLQEVAHVYAERERHRAEIRRVAGIPGDALIALSVGRLHPSKGHQYALEALPALVRRFPELHWMVIGKEWEEEREALEQRARELGVERHMHLMGFVEEPLPFYAASDIYFRTPVYEAENLSSCQAMAMGLPAVGFETGSEVLLELIGKAGHGLLVPPRDAEALAEAAIKILSLPDRGRSLGERGANYCRAHLDFQQLVSILVAVYTELHRSQRRDAN
jgi:glycosyltransferase involved in cell wall biosynthesis